MLASQPPSFRPVYKALHRRLTVWEQRVMGILDAAQRSSYERDGYLVLEGFASRDACAELQARSEERRVGKECA